MLSQTIIIKSFTWLSTRGFTSEDCCMHNIKNNSVPSLVCLVSGTTGAREFERKFCIHGQVRHDKSYPLLAKGKRTDRKPTEKTPYHATTYYSIFPSRQILPRRNNDLTTYSRTVTMFDKPWAKSNISCTHPEETLAGYCCQNKHGNNVLALLSRCRTISSCLE